MPKFQVYIKRYFDDEVIEKFMDGLSSREVQALRTEEHLLPGELIDFDAIEMTGGLLRRSPLKRGTSNLKRSELKRSEKAINKVSEKRKKENRVRAKVMVSVRERDGNRCQLQKVIGTACVGPLHGHEVLKRSRGGKITDKENILLACDGHNGWVEDHPMVAEVYGLSLPSKT